MILRNTDQNADIMETLQGMALLPWKWPLDPTAQGSLGLPMHFSHVHTHATFISFPSHVLCDCNRLLCKRACKTMSHRHSSQAYTPMPTHRRTQTNRQGRNNHVCRQPPGNAASWSATHLQILSADITEDLQMSCPNGSKQNQT
jgi:hypothetical protein